MSDPRLTRWEYKTVSWRWHGTWADLSAKLNEWGEERWEVISVDLNHYDVKILMKRPKGFESGAY